MENGDVILKVDGISLFLLDKPILNKVTFNVHDRVRPNKTTGQIIGILGPSGVGKTRLLRILAGLDTPTSGTVTGFGIDTDAGNVRYVFQDYPLLHHLTVRKNLEKAGKYGGLSKWLAIERANELLGRFGLVECADRYPCQISGGQQQRAAIAQQIMCPRRLMLLDEPFSGLDPIAISDVSAMLSSVADLHDLNTIVVVTHDIRAAVAVSDTLHLLGRDKNDSKGAYIKASYDLVERGLAWKHDIAQTPEFINMVTEIESQFRNL